MPETVGNAGIFVRRGLKFLAQDLSVLLNLASSGGILKKKLIPDSDLMNFQGWKDYGVSAKKEEESNHQLNQSTVTRKTSSTYLKPFSALHFQGSTSVWEAYPRAFCVQACNCCHGRKFVSVAFC